MKEWSGLERVYRLSLGVEIGAHALALLAALEFKRLLQKDVMAGAVENEQVGQVINLSSAEWCALAGIFDRKAYDRAKAKLEEYGIVGVQREGRVLRITLWPELRNKASMSTEKDPAKDSAKQMESNIGNHAKEEVGDANHTFDSSSPRANHISTIDGSDSKVENGTGCRIRNGTASRTSRETCNRTSGGTADGTNHGTAGGSSDGVTPETIRSTLLRQKAGKKRQEPSNNAVLGRICDNYLPFSQSQDITYRVGRYRLKRYSLYRYSLIRNSLLINIMNNNSNSNSSISNNNNEQRNNGLMFIHKLIHKSVDKLAKEGEFGDKKTVDKKSPVIKAVDKKALDKYAGFLNSQKKTIGSRFKRLWQGEMGYELTAYQEEGILRFIRWGFSEEILIEALRCAVMADRKHMGYVLGVLRNWYNQGVRELKDISHVQQRWQDQRFLQRSVSRVV